MGALMAGFHVGRVSQPARPRAAEASDAPAHNPVGRAQARLATALKSGGPQPAAEEEWEEF
jgi:hypothetical protein